MQLHEVREWQHPHDGSMGIEMKAANWPCFESLARTCVLIQEFSTCFIDFTCLLSCNGLVMFLKIVSAYQCLDLDRLAFTWTRKPI